MVLFLHTLCPSCLLYVWHTLLPRSMLLFLHSFLHSVLVLWCTLSCLVIGWFFCIASSEIITSFLAYSPIRFLDTWLDMFLPIVGSCWENIKISKNNFFTLCTVETKLYQSTWSETSLLCQKFGFLQHWKLFWLEKAANYIKGPASCYLQSSIRYSLRAM